MARHRWLVGFAAGLTAWSGLEYAVHRWIMHRRGAGDPFAREHTDHHRRPRDARPLRLDRHTLAYKGAAFAVASGAALPVTGRIGAPRARAIAFGAGLTVGYCAYTEWHHGVHHRAMRNRFTRQLQEHHLRHHRGEPEHFGVTSPLWDLRPGARLTVRHRPASPPT